jgi:type I restriction enzyme R subunit
VLKFHVDYYKATAIDANKKNVQARIGDLKTQGKIVETILDKHMAATNGRKFNAIFATGSINEAISYYQVFKQVQAKRLALDPNALQLNIACVFSPPADGNSDIKQLADDLPQEVQDNKEQPDEKKAALNLIMSDYNACYGTNHSISQFDLYYQDVQKRIKDQQYANSDVPQAQKIDITLVVDMLLTGFDSKYLNTLYVDKNLKYHGLIQAFSRTNRILNDSKPYGSVIDFRGLEEFVDEAIALFSNVNADEDAKNIWLVESAAQVIAKLAIAKKSLDDLMIAKGLEPLPHDVVNLQGDTARAEFVNAFKEIQRLQTQLDQYTDLTENQLVEIEKILPTDQLRSFKAVYLETAKQLKEQQDKPDAKKDDAVQQLDFEFVLFNSAVIDYDYIMGLLAEYSQNNTPQQMTREQLIQLITSDAKFIDEREQITAYIYSLEMGAGLSESNIREGYQRFKLQQFDEELAKIAAKHGLATKELRLFVEATLARMVLDSDLLRELLLPLNLSWKTRSSKEKALIADLTEPMYRRTNGREVSGWAAYL